MHLVLLIGLNIIIFSVGMHFKRENESSRSKAIQDKYLDYMQNNPKIYYHKINSIGKKLEKGKKIEPYERRLLQKEAKSMVHHSLNEESTDTDDTSYISKELMASDELLDDDEYLASIFIPEKNSLLNKLKDRKRGKDMRMYDDLDYSSYGYANSDSMYGHKKIKSVNNLPSSIEKYCECLTDKKYKYDPAVGREKEIEELMIAILTPGKSGLLLGKAGVGKTAILEGLAYRIQKGDVPKSLKNFVVYKTDGATLNSGCSLNGMLEKRVLELFKALSKTDNIILFMDEIHTLIGEGKSKDGGIDIANIIKPYITLENIHLVGATTQLEYEEYMLYDTAFCRRFSNITINEPKDEDLVIILNHVLENMAKIYNIKIAESLKNAISISLVEATNPKRRNYDFVVYNPDLAITIISKAFGYARLYDKNKISEQDFIRAYNTTDTVRGELVIKCNANQGRLKNIIPFSKIVKAK